MKLKKQPNISLNNCFIDLSEEFSMGSKNDFEWVMVNELSVLELLHFTVFLITKTRLYNFNPLNPTFI